MFLHARFTKFRRTAWQELNQNCAVGTSSESFHATGVHFVRPRMLASHCAQVMASCTSCTLLRRAITAAWSSTRGYRNIFTATARTAESWWRGLCASLRTYGLKVIDKIDTFESQILSKSVRAILLTSPVPFRGI